jgi:shikimate dehydrogenase
MASQPAPASDDDAGGDAHRAAVLGKPIAHSLSPVLHNAGYAAAGLTGWSYTAIECAEAELAGVVAELPAQWAGLSLTMPLKEVGLQVADVVDPVTAALGATNTLVRRPDGWHATNTDAPGMVDALGTVGLTRAGSVAILGAGGTARAALAAARAVGAGTVTLYARRPAAREELGLVAEDLGFPLGYRPFSAAAECAEADLVISTVPAGAADQLAVPWRSGTVLFDALYDPWPTPLAAAALAAGCRVVSGLELLLAQAVRQFRLFTGVAAPAAAMREALFAAARVA